MRRRIRQLGFTLLEALLSVALLAMLTGISLPIYASFANRTDLDTTAQSIVEMYRRAQLYSRGVKDDITWGVRVESSFATLFRGATYASRDASYDETTTIPSSITKTAGLTEVVFAELTGLPNTSGSFSLIVTPSGTRSINLNAKGMVTYVNF